MNATSFLWRILEFPLGICDFYQTKFQVTLFLLKFLCGSLSRDMHWSNNVQLETSAMLGWNDVWAQTISFFEDDLLNQRKMLPIAIGINAEGMKMPARIERSGRAGISRTHSWEAQGDSFALTWLWIWDAEGTERSSDRMQSRKLGHRLSEPSGKKKVLTPYIQATRDYTQWDMRFARFACAMRLPTDDG